MACNPIRFLENPGNDLGQFKAALSYSQVGDCLNENDWQLLYYSPDMETVKKIICDILNRYYSLSKILDNPQTSEEWYSKVWGGFLKTRKKSAFFKIYNQIYSGKLWDNPYYTFNGYDNESTPK